MSEATTRFAAFLQLSDKFLGRAEREDLADGFEMVVGVLGWLEQEHPGH